jgi:hypothetical protein
MFDHELAAGTSFLSERFGDAGRRRQRKLCGSARCPALAWPPAAEGAERDRQVRARLSLAGRRASQ